MHSSFTFINPNVHRVPGSQQQSGHPIFNIGAPASTFLSHTPNLFVNHPAFSRSFASVVSCDNFGIRQQFNSVNKMNANNYSGQTSPQHTNNNSGIISSILKHFNKPTNTSPAHQQGPRNQQNKEFEDFTHLPGFNMPIFRSSPPSQFSPHSQPSQSNKSDTETAPPSANNMSPSMTAPARNFVASLFGQGQSRPKNPRWYHRGFRCRSRGWRNQNNNKFRHDDVNMSKSIHEKERSGAGKGIHDDSDDFVDLMDEMNEMNGNVNKTYETAHGSCARAPTVESLPFTICSMDDFPAIDSTKKPLRQKKSPSPAKNIKKQAKREKVVAAAIPETADPEPTPKVERTPFVDTLMLSKKALDRVFPSKAPGRIAPILKNPSECFCVNTSVDTSSWLNEKARLQSCDEIVVLMPQFPKKQRIPSECSVDDDFIVFGSECHDSPDCDEDLWSGSEEDESDSDSDTESELDEDDEDDLDESNVSGNTEVAVTKETPPNEDQDLESGFHEPTKKKVNSTFLGHWATPLTVPFNFRFTSTRSSGCDPSRCTRPPAKPHVSATGRRWLETTSASSRASHDPCFILGTSSTANTALGSTANGSRTTKTNLRLVTLQKFPKTFRSCIKISNSLFKF